VGVPFPVMKRFTVNLPDGLHREARDADLNLSEILRQGVKDRLGKTKGCQHTRVRCEVCGAHIDVDEAVADPSTIEEAGSSTA
jgi:hypothetical protein